MKFSTISLISFACYVSGLTVNEVNGPAVLSAYVDQTVNLTGIVTAVGPSGFFLRDKVPAKRTKKNPGSSSVYVYGSASAKIVKSGDEVSFSAQVAEYRSAVAYIPLTELMYPTDLQVVSQGNKVTPILVGKGKDGLQPPTEEFSALDGGDIFAIPNDQAKFADTTLLQPSKYGLDFWESLSGELVSIDGPVALGESSRYGDIWIRGNWKVTGLNSRGGLTITADKKGSDSNPESILIGEPLDGTSNSKAKLGDVLAPFKGVVTYAFGFYRILPTTALTVTAAATGKAAPTKYTTKGSCKGLTLGQYNVLNLNPKSSHVGGIVTQIVDILKTPDLIYLQEIQDNDGATDSGTVSGNLTLSTLTTAIAEQSGVQYAATEVIPENNLDGGAPGSNIRVAYLYNPSVLTLTPGAPVGGPHDAVQINKDLKLSHNPGRIAPASAAWNDSRKPIIASFTVNKTKKPFFAINVHFSSKGGSSSIHGDPRPMINGAIDARVAQLAETTAFINQVLKFDKNANIVIAGDFNEFSGVSPMVKFVKDTGLTEIDEVVKIKPAERYSYSYDGNCQTLDHMFVSKSVKKGTKGYEHLHVNTWWPVEQVSDHDPAVGLFDVC